MDSHVFIVHTLQRCHICSEAFTNMAALKNHVMKHLNNELEYSCGVCNKLYKTIEEAKDHAMKVCGIIQEKRGQSEQKKEWWLWLLFLQYHIPQQNSIRET